MKKLFLFLAIIIGGHILAQSNLNLFTEEGENFTLFLNGIQQNSKPQSNVKVQNIMDNIQKIRLVFDDKNIQTISQNLFYEVGKEYTYNVRKKNNDANKLKRIDEKKITPLVYVIRIQDVKDMPQVVINNKAEIVDNATDQDKKVIVEEPKVELNQSNITIHSDVNIINYVIPKLDTNTVVVRDTIFSKDKRHHNYKKNKSDQKSKADVVCNPMSAATFLSLTEQIKKQSFEDNKMQIINQVLVNSCISAAQVKNLMGNFSFEENKLKVAKLCYSKTTDKENYFTLNDAFKFSSSVDEMSQFLQNKGTVNNNSK